MRQQQVVPRHHDHRVLRYQQKPTSPGPAVDHHVMLHPLPPGGPVRREDDFLRHADVGPRRVGKSLRLLISSGELSLNRPGASGWVTDQGLWLLSKRGVDAIREQPTKEGHDGLPTDSRRIFEIMAEGRLLDLDDARKAVWCYRVQSDDWKPDTTFTMLRFPLDVIWDDTDAVPLYDGAVIMESGESGNGNAEDGSRPRVSRQPQQISRSSRRRIHGKR